MTPTAQIMKAEHLRKALSAAEIERFIDAVVALLAEPGAFDPFVRRIDTLLKNAAEKAADAAPSR